MAVTTLFLVRHGETDWNAERRVQGQLESRLNDRGLQQAVERAGQINDLAVDAVYCSSSHRTRQTAHALLSGKTDGVVYQDNLREICLGVWEGKLRAEIDQISPLQVQHFFQQPELFQLQGAETFSSLQGRAISALTDIVTQHSGKRILVVSHGALIKASLLHWLHWPLSQMWVDPQIGNCSVSAVEFGDQGARVLRVGDLDQF